MAALFGEEIEELKNLIESIKTNAAYVGDEMTLPQDVRNSLREITKSANQAQRILNMGDRR